MLIGSVRVSKSDGSQALAPQRDVLLAANVDAERIYQDLASGRHDDRPGLAACLKALRSGDTLVLWRLDRLGRDLRHNEHLNHCSYVLDLSTPPAPLPFDLPTGCGPHARTPWPLCEDLAQIVAMVHYYYLGRNKNP